MNDDNASEESRRTILSILLRASKEDERMTSEMVMSNILLFMLAGHETTAKSLAWTLYAMGKVRHCSIIQNLAFCRQINAVHS